MFQSFTSLHEHSCKTNPKVQLNFFCPLISRQGLIGSWKNWCLTFFFFSLAVDQRKQPILVGDVMHWYLYLSFIEVKCSLMYSFLSLNLLLDCQSLCYIIGYHHSLHEAQSDLGVCIYASLPVTLSHVGYVQITIL